VLVHILINNSGKEINGISQELTNGKPTPAINVHLIIIAIGKLTTCSAMNKEAYFLWMTSKPSLIGG
jgi:fluoride ion exporter CrcB/FEX